MSNNKKPNLWGCPYRSRGLLDKYLCIIDIDHLTMPNDNFKEFVIENIKKYDKKDNYFEKKTKWLRYYKFVLAIKKCEELDKEALNDRSKRIAWFLDDKDIEKIKKYIPDETIENLGMKCACKYKEDSNK